MWAVFAVYLVLVLHIPGFLPQCQYTFDNIRSQLCVGVWCWNCCTILFSEVLSRLPSGFLKQDSISLNLRLSDRFSCAKVVFTPWLQRYRYNFCDFTQSLIEPVHIFVTYICMWLYCALCISPQNCFHKFYSELLRSEEQNIELGFEEEPTILIYR